MFNKLKKTISGVLVFGLIVTSGITFSACHDDKEKEDDKKTEASTPQDATKKASVNTDKEDDTNNDSTSDTTATQQLNSLCDDLFKEAVTSDALTLNYIVSDPAYLDLEDYPDTMVSFDPEDVFVDLEENDEYMQRLEKIDYDALTPSQKITYDSIKYTLDCSNSLSGLEYYSEPLGPTQGFQAELPVSLSEYTFYTAADIERYLTALPTLYKTFEDIIKFEQDKSENGLFMSDAMADKIISQCKDFIAKKENNYLITSFDDKVNNYEGLTEAQKKDYCARNKDIVLNKIIPAYELLITELTKLKGTGTNENGLCYYTDGKKYYQYLIYSSVGDHVKVSEVKKVLRNRINKDINELSQMYLKNSNIFEDMAEAETQKTDPKEILDELYEDMQQDFPEIPKIDYSLKYVDKSLAEYLSPAMYFKPPVDNNAINSIYINEPQITSSDDFFNTLAHEGFPGHMYQFNYELNNDNFALRQIIVPTGVTEGWATRVQYKSYDYIDDIPADLSKALALNGEMSLCIEAVADIGVNYEGWDRDDLKDYFSNYFELDDDAVEEIYLSYLESPANVLCYAYGCAALEELEDDAKEKKEDDFSELEFNRFLLDVGFAPFSVIKDRYNEQYK